MNQINEEIKFCIETGRWNTFGKLGGIESSHIANYFISRQPKIDKSLYINAGIYLENFQEFQEWCNIYVDSVRSLDYVLEWCPEQGDKYIIDNVWKGKRRVYSFDDFEPFIHLKNGWHYAFKNKKILVLSPFEKTIYKQIENYSKIWEGAEIGDIKIIKTPFSSAITGEKPRKFIEIYREISDKINQSEYDFAIIGVGGLSLPLLNVVKNMNKPGIHLGGATQILFGISASRWDNNKKFIDSNWYNKNNFWTRPLPEEVPKNCNLVENGCYW